MLATALVCLSFLTGTWTGDSTGADQGKGWFSFEPRQNGRVLLRTNHAEYPAQDGKPASVHDDFMAIEAAGDAIKAIFVDNEGNAINYAVTCGDDHRSATFVSAEPGKPPFKLDYKLVADDVLEGEFDVAGKPYRRWTGRKKQ